MKNLGKYLNFEKLKWRFYFYGWKWNIDENRVMGYYSFVNWFGLNIKKMKTL